MKPTAIGRILLWRGGSLWIGRAGEPADRHSHHAIQIALPFPGGRVRFRSPEESWTSHAAAIVAAHQVHEFEARDQFVAMIFVEPESRDGRVLQRRYRDRGIAPLDDVALQHEMAALAAAYTGRADDTQLIALAHAAIAALARGTTSANVALDGRVERAIGLVREQFGSGGAAR